PLQRAVDLGNQQTLVGGPVPARLEREICWPLNAVEIPVALDQLGRAINNQRRAVDILKEAWFESLSIQSVLELFRISFHRWAHNAETITP
ncbi:hypothetical protein, partial [Pseudomonas aeruginosa]|uniref:hypothetical protein n=1 Tax=Pseudomonas aeruginosa TaxID=287 RepID=UPI0034597516